MWSPVQQSSHQTWILLCWSETPAGWNVSQSVSQSVMNGFLCSCFQSQTTPWNHEWSFTQEVKYTWKVPNQVIFCTRWEVQQSSWILSYWLLGHTHYHTQQTRTIAFIPGQLTSDRSRLALASWEVYSSWSWNELQTHPIRTRRWNDFATVLHFHSQQKAESTIYTFGSLGYFYKSHSEITYTWAWQHGAQERYQHVDNMLFPLKFQLFEFTHSLLS